MKIKSTSAALALTFGLAASANAVLISGVTYTLDTAPDAGAEYTDSATALTDGLHVTGGSAVTIGSDNPAVVGWADGTAAQITFNLGGTFDLNSVTVNGVAVDGFAKNLPSGITVLGSTDNGATFNALTVGTAASFTEITDGAFTFTNGAAATETYTGAAALTNVRVTLAGAIGTGHNGFLIDEVSFDGTAVPEPSSTALLGLGGLALILRRRK